MSSHNITTVGIVNKGLTCYINVCFQILFSLSGFRNLFLGDWRLESLEEIGGKASKGMNYGAGDVAHSVLVVRKLKDLFNQMIATEHPWIDVDNQLISWLSAGTLNLNVLRVNALQPEATAEEVFSDEKEIHSPPPTQERDVFLQSKTEADDVSALFMLLIGHLYLASEDRDDYLDEMFEMNLDNQVLTCMLSKREEKEIYRSSADLINDCLKYSQPDPFVTPKVLTMSMDPADKDAETELVSFLADVYYPPRRGPLSGLYTPVRYTLHSLVEYVPGGIGHYIAYIKSHRAKQWWRFDDRTVSLVSDWKQNIHSTNIRLAVYIRTDVLFEEAY